jgi:hypothetical protein
MSRQQRRARHISRTGDDQYSAVLVLVTAAQRERMAFE